MKPVCHADLMRDYARETQPTDAELEALRARLDALVIDGESSQALLLSLPGPDPVEVADLKRRVHLAHRPRRAPMWVLAGTAVGVAALAAVALLAVGVAGLAAVTSGADRPVATELALVEAPVLVAPAPGVALRYAGQGSVGGSEQAPIVAWKAGELEVSVDPTAGVALAVQTREAHVRVLGTVFTVDRDALGTTVEVERGRVAVTCLAGGDHELGAGESLTCLPLTAAGLLGRAMALEAAGALPDEVIAAVDLGIHASPSAAVDRELRTTRFRALGEAGRHAEALVEVDRLIAEDGPRHTELLVAGVTLALNEADCARALPWVDALRAERALPKELAVRVKSCR